MGERAAGDVEAAVDEFMGPWEDRVEGERDDGGGGGGGPWG